MGDAQPDRLTAPAFRRLVKDKGWMLRAVADRWEISDTWLSKLVNDSRRAAHWDDACRGLPDLRCGIAALSAAELRALKKEKGGWITQTLAARWNMVEQTEGHIFRKSGRPLVWDDALRGVPHISGNVPPLCAEVFRARLQDKGWPAEMLAFRWRLSPEQLAEMISNPDRGEFWDDACRGLPDSRLVTTGQEQNTERD